MKFLLNKIKKHSAIYGFGHMLNRCIVFAILPLYTNYIEPNEYGIAAILFTFLAIMSIFYNYGFDVGFLRFFVLESNVQKRNTIFSTAVLCISISSSIFSAMIIIFSNTLSVFLFNMGAYTNLLILVSGILFFDTLALISFNVLRAEERSTKFIILQFLNIIVNISSNIILIAFCDMGVVGIFVSNFISSCFTFITLLPTIFKHLILRFSEKIFKELLRFGIPVIPSMLSIVLMDKIDRYFLCKMLGMETTGLYSMGYKLGMFMAHTVAAFKLAWHPFFLSISDDNKRREISARILTYFIFISSIIYLIISFFINDIIKISLLGIEIFGEKYWDGVYIVPVLILSYVFYGIHIHLISVLYLKKRTNYLPFISIFSVVLNIVGNLILIPIFGMMGAAYATLLAFFCMALLSYLITQHYYRIHFEFQKILKIVMILAVIIYISKINVGSFETLYHFILVFVYLATLSITVNIKKSIIPIKQ